MKKTLLLIFLIIMNVSTSNAGIAESQGVKTVVNHSLKSSRSLSAGSMEKDKLNQNHNNYYRKDPLKNAEEILNSKIDPLKKVSELKNLLLFKEFTLAAKTRFKEMDKCRARGEDLSQCRLFSGKTHNCSVKFWGGINSCGDEKTLLQKIFDTADEKAQELKLKRNESTCVFVGEKKMKYGFEVKKKFCCFGSKFAKIIQLQERAQTGRGFGTYSRPDCSGLNKDQLKKFQKDGVDKLDLSEIYGDVYSKVEKSILGCSAKSKDSSLKTIKDISIFSFLDFKTEYEIERYLKHKFPIGSDIKPAMSFLMRREECFCRQVYKPDIKAGAPKNTAQILLCKQDQIQTIKGMTAGVIIAIYSDSGGQIIDFYINKHRGYFDKFGRWAEIK